MKSGAPETKTGTTKGYGTIHYKTAAGWITRRHPAGLMWEPAEGIYLASIKRGSWVIEIVNPRTGETVTVPADSLR